MLEDTLKMNTQDALGRNDNIKAASLNNENIQVKPVAESLAKDVLAILALKPELFF